MDKKKFFDAIRSHVNLTTQNVQGMDKVLDYVEQVEDNLQHAAKIIATGWWETAQTMMPVREAYWLSESWRKKNLRYYPYYGRGYVQLTWEFNYRKASDYFGVDFVKSPDLVMEPEYALPILVTGMNEGWFTGKKLDDYIDDIDDNDTEEYQEYKNARRIVNGTDKDDEIARLCLIFEEGLKAGGFSAVNTSIKPIQSHKDVSGTQTPEIKKPSVQPRMTVLEYILNFLLKMLKGR